MNIHELHFPSLLIWLSALLSPLQLGNKSFSPVEAARSAPHTVSLTQKERQISSRLIDRAGSHRPWSWKRRLHLLADIGLMSLLPSWGRRRRFLKGLEGFRLSQNVKFRPVPSKNSSISGKGRYCNHDMCEVTRWNPQRVCVTHTHTLHGWRPLRRGTSAPTHFFL